MNYGQLILKYPNQIGYGALHYFFSGLGQTFLISLFVAHFTTSLSINNIQFSWFYSGATLASALVLPFLGQYLDKIKVRYFSLGVAISLAVFSFMAASVQDLIVLALALFGLRLCGQGLLTLTASTATARYFNLGRGKALSLVGFGVSFSEFTLPFLVTALIAGIGWRYTWVVMGIAVVVIFIPTIIQLIPINSTYQHQEEESHEEKNENFKDATRLEVLKDFKFYLLVLVYLWVPFFVTGVFIHQNIIASTNGWSLTLMATCISAFGVTRLIANLFLGPVIDQFTATRSFSFVLIPQILGSILLIFSQSPWAAIVFFMLCGTSASLSSLTGTAMWAEIYGTAHLGAIRSMVSTIMVFSTAIAPVVMGWGFSRESWIIPTWWIMAGLMGAFTIIAFIIVTRVSKFQK